jgi:REP element-mobilizing transposase RayT
VLPRIYRRNLPHYLPERVPIFFTWRLHGSLPARRPAVAPATETNGQKFRNLDRDLDRAATDPKWLKDPRIASVVQEEVEIGAYRFRRYELFEYVVMPNHVHLLIFPFRHPAQLMRWLKASSSRRANAILGRTGQPFWQDESFDRWCRDATEVLRMRQYIALNPVKCGLAKRAEDWPWSSVHRQLLRKQAKLIQRDVTCNP